MREDAKPLIHVVEDDREVGRLICATLGQYGYRTEHFPLGRDLLHRLKTTSPALCIVDLGLPDCDGLQVVREVQESGRCAVIILTGRGHTSDRVLGLEFGADDYVVKPFEPRELVARVRSVLRRYERAEGIGKNAGVARFEGWRFDLGAQTLAHDDGRAMVLGTAEAELLKVLLRAPNRILSRGYLLELKETGDAGPFDRSIDVRISRLRRKIEADPQNPALIKTVYGAGYMFCSAVTWE